MVEGCCGGAWGIGLGDESYGAEVVDGLVLGEVEGARW